MKPAADSASRTLQSISGCGPETWIAFPENIRIDVAIQPIAGVTEPAWCSTPEFCVFSGRFDFDPPPAA
jgi:hypothetical protein